MNDVNATNLSMIEESLRPLAMPLEQVQLDPRNARAHPEANLKAIEASLNAFGQQKPIVIDHAGLCLAGNGTVAAARRLGWTHIAAVRSGLTAEHARAYTLADNRTTDTSQWDVQRLAEHLAALQNREGFDHTVTGFSDAEIERLIDQAVNLEREDDKLPDEVEVGELYQVLVACADESEQKAVYEQLAGEGRKCRLLTL